jgi:hypothetical protein
MSLHQEEERICRDTGNQDGLARSLMNQSAFLLGQGEIERAKTAALEAERLHRDIGDTAYLVVDLYNLGRSSGTRPW